MAYPVQFFLFYEVLARSVGDAMTEALVMYAKAFDTGAFLPLDPLVEWVRS